MVRSLERLYCSFHSVSFLSLRQLASPSSTLLSLTGYLELQQKSCESVRLGLCMLGKRSSLSSVGRGRQKKQYWFWFDEQTCHLKYYRNQEAYQHSLFDPLMFVQMLSTELIEYSSTSLQDH